VQGAGPAAMLRGERRCRRRPQHRCPSHGEHRLLELAPAMKEERGFGRLFWQAHMAKAKPKNSAAAFHSLEARFAKLLRLHHHKTKCPSGEILNQVNQL
jgi:hypothetical protein